MAGQGKLRLLVVDDSASNRRHIRELLTGSGEVEVVGEAADGQEALNQAFQLKPEAITLDLEMPRMDGFTFLRLLMSKQPTPVLVISRHSEKQNVFKALELGAVDFLEKPARWSEEVALALRTPLLEKIALMRGLCAERRPLRAVEAASGSQRPPPLVERPQLRIPPRHLVVIASSAGGPAALLEIFSKLPARVSFAILVAQHMPERFTGTFAKRLELRSNLTVREARNGELVSAQHAYVCPGARCMELQRDTDGVSMRLRVMPPRVTDRYVPSADRLLLSVAQVAGPRAVAVVLTGMGDDGAAGASAVRSARGTVVVESRETAVVPGMPTAAAPSAHQVLPLAGVAEFLARLG